MGAVVAVNHPRKMNQLISKINLRMIHKPSWKEWQKCKNQVALAQ